MGDVDVADPQGSVPKPKRRWYRRRLRTVLATIVVLVVLNGLLIFHFRVHLVLRYAMAFGGLREAKAIPAGPMPEAPEPKDWVRCRFGSAEFSLPPKMAANVETTRNGAFRVFRDGSVSVMVDLPNDAVSMEKDLESATQMPPQGCGMSGPRLRLAWCQTSSADFRWSMSPDEVHWLTWCIVMNNLGQIITDGWAETTFGNEMDGILLIRQDRRFACFEWQSKTKAVYGYINFQDKSGELDPEWLRRVCKSVRVCEGTDSGEPPTPIRAEGPVGHPAKP